MNIVKREKRTDMSTSMKSIESNSSYHSICSGKSAVNFAAETRTIVIPRRSDQDNELLFYDREDIEDFKLDRDEEQRSEQRVSLSWDKVLNEKKVDKVVRHSNQTNLDILRRNK